MKQYKRKVTDSAVIESHYHPRDFRLSDRSMFAKKSKLLFFAYAFPPLRAIGSVRAWNIAKYLGRLGWEVTVVTPETSLWRDIENWEEVMAEFEEEGIRRISTGHRWRHLAAGWLKCW